MRPRDVPGYLRDLVLRLLPHAAPTGLIAIGDPGPDAPVLLTGNYALTVRRLREALRGHDAWLLCANSRGINVWCAAGGGHLTHHDIISVLRTSGVADRVAHRDLVLPQLAATGVERRAITEVTGWTTRWGPARLEDLPAFLDRGRRVKKHERSMRFPLWERMEMAVMWLAPMLLLGAPIAGAAAGIAAAATGALGVIAVVAGLFALTPWLPHGRGARTAVFAGWGLVSAGLGVGALAALGALSAGAVTAVLVFTLAGTAILMVDFAGTTPWLASTVNTLGNEARIELVEERCTGAADCVLVCPREVLEMDGRARKVRVVRPDQCIECGACVVQCPSDALRFRFADGRVAEPETLRTTRMNMLGRRTVRVDE
ncbi:MAG: 4Fe-4S dicluster domain-containing protein [Myxococcales bacterium]|nr:4Fe-4S dicluster domain-containing protein [Myxococcales bacterium]